ncbi:MAG: HPF/RaiA family ribosome-associated protein [Thermodesulfovibrionales bacterium]
MNIQITSRGIELSKLQKEEIRGKIDRLGRYYERIMRCRVVVEAPHRHKHEGRQFRVCIEMRVPGEDIIVKRQLNEDLDIALRDAFDAARREIEDYVRRQRGVVKYHEEPPQGRITSLFLNEGYGFLTTLDGREIYFHKNSVINRDFSQLKTGMRVRFAEEEGDKGPQASSVTIIE